MALGLGLDLGLRLGLGVFPLIKVLCSVECDGAFVTVGLITFLVVYIRLCNQEIDFVSS